MSDLIFSFLIGPSPEVVALNIIGEAALDVALATRRYQSRCRPCAALLVPLAFVVFCFLGGCKSADSARAQDTNSSSRSLDSTGQSGPNRCALLHDDEIREAIGLHSPGSSEVNNEWGLQSCQWKATTAQKVEGYPQGWFDTIEVAVFDKERVSWARGQAKGDPVTGFVEGAQYDTSYGQLWFNCARDRFCVVKARTASGANREQIARRLAQVVESRLR